jgi:hypothetical protein
MKRLLIGLVALAVFAISVSAHAGASWPDKGWHKGPYLTANAGMMQVVNDRHVVTGRKFNGPINPSFGLTFGWDIADWIGPMLQINYSFASGSVGTADGSAGGYVPGTFPLQNAKEHVINLGLYARATLPYFINAGWQGNNLKVIPYLKLGGVGHALYVNASNANNKTGAYGGGIGMGAGVEFFVWKGLMFAIEGTEHIIFQGSYHKTINGILTKVVDGGTKFQFNVQGLIGWHF